MAGDGSLGSGQRTYTMTAQYVYGVVPADAGGVDCTGIGGSRVGTVVDGDLAAVVSDLAGDAELEAGSDELLVHSHVLDAALAQGPVLPMRFGVVLEGEDAVRGELLAAFHDELMAQLDEVDGRVELHLRAVYDEARLMRDVIDGRREIGRLRDRLRGRPANATYYERIQLGEMVAAAVEQIRQGDTEAILDALAPLAVATSVDPVDHEQVAANLCFLVEGEQLAAFDGAVDELGEREQGRMRFKYTGPFPAYSFVELPG